jgi:hypothetical protein
MAAFEFVLGLFLLAYAAFEQPTFRMLRGGAILAGVGLFGCLYFKRWQKKRELQA